MKKAVRSKKVDLDLVLKAIADEPELPGEMPDSMWEHIKGNKRDTSAYFRIAVRVTKEGIRDRILKALERKEK